MTTLQINPGIEANAPAPKPKRARRAASLLSALGIIGRQEGESLGSAVARVGTSLNGEYREAIRSAIAARDRGEGDRRSRMAEAANTRGEADVRAKIMAEREAAIIGDDGVATLADALGLDMSDVLADAAALERADALAKSVAAMANAEGVLAAAEERVRATAKALEAAQRAHAEAMAALHGANGTLQSREVAKVELVAVRQARPHLFGEGGA